LFFRRIRVSKLAAWFFHQRPISVHQRSGSAVFSFASLAPWRETLLAVLVAGRGSLSLTQRRKDAKGKCRNLSQGPLQARSTTGSLVLPSASHQRPSASISGPVLRSGSAVRLCGLLLGELSALARNPLSGSGCWPGSLSLTQRRKGAKGKSRDLSQGLQQAKSTTGSLVLPSAVRFCGPALRSSPLRA
jgi:hypothetical protein